MLTLTLLKASLRAGMRSGLRTAWWMIKLTMAVSFAVFLLQYAGIIDMLSSAMTPLFAAFGLGGEAALVFISGALVNHYAAIAVIQTIGFDQRSITILALMLLCAHNLVIETAIQKKTGSSAIQMVLLRLLLAFASAFILNAALPPAPMQPPMEAHAAAGACFLTLLKDWTQSIVKLVCMMFAIIMGLTLLQRVLADAGAIRSLSKSLRPLMKALGLPAKTSFLWIVSQTLGLAYGGAVMLEEKERGKVSDRELDLLNYHIAASHSNIEDVMLYFALGAPLLWMYALRIAFAVAVVWMRRGLDILAWNKK
jgi:spore maturation protein SpmB